jgi:hypothetical protein
MRLRLALQHWIGPLQILKREGERKLPSHYFCLLEEGKSVEVEGYEWSAAGYSLRRVRIGSIDAAW